MFIHNIDPVLLNLGPFEIRYYGLVYLLGFVIAYFFLIYLSKERKLKLTKDSILDLLVYSAIGTIIGARILYVLENIGFYISNPFEIIAVWHGGLSFYGGLIGVVVTGLIFCKKKNVDFYKIADMAVIPLALALVFGRIANFINAEIYGKVTDVKWCVNFPNVEGCRHPSQIYEAFKNLIIFFILFFIRNLKLPKGFLFWSFIVLYSGLRFIMEFFREPAYLIGGLTLHQMLSIITLLIGLLVLTKLE